MSFEGKELAVPVLDDDVYDAYVYLLSRYLVLRQEIVDSQSEGFAYNRIHYNPLGSSDFVNPNLDVAYLEAWFAVDESTPVIFEVPEIEGRYYTAQIVDEWGEVIVNINERATPSAPSGRFVLTKPGSRPELPEDAIRLDLHGSKAKLLARIELQGDEEGAVALQQRFRAEPLGEVQIDVSPVIPLFDNDALIGVEIFDLAEGVLASALDVSPDAARWQLLSRQIAARVAASPVERARVDEFLRNTGIPRFKEWAITQSTPMIDGWGVVVAGGNYGSDVRLRTAANYIGIWANTPKEVVYAISSRDVSGAPLDGSRRYDLHFSVDALPDSVVDSYWSVILVSVPDYRVVPNELNRYNLNQYSPLVRNADGSLTITVSPELPEGTPSANWLPSPVGRLFSLTFRSYVPNKVVPFGQWSPPPLTPAS